MLDFGGGLGTFLELLDFICGVLLTAQLAGLARRFSSVCPAPARRGLDHQSDPLAPLVAARSRIDRMRALDAGFAGAEQDGLPPVGLCISLLRTQSADEAIELVELLAALRHPRVVALSIDGNEAAAGL